MVSELSLATLCALPGAATTLRPARSAAQRRLGRRDSPSGPCRDRAERRARRRSRMPRSRPRERGRSAKAYELAETRLSRALAASRQTAPSGPGPRMRRDRAHGRSDAGHGVGRGAACSSRKPTPGSSTSSPLGVRWRRGTRSSSRGRGRGSRNGCARCARDELGFGPPPLERSRSGERGRPDGRLVACLTGRVNDQCFRTHAARGRDRPGGRPARARSNEGDSYLGTTLVSLRQEARGRGGPRGSGRHGGRSTA